MIPRLLVCCALAATAATAEVDRDLRHQAAGAGAGWTVSGASWTADGLFLPAGRLTPVPATYPPGQQDLPPSRPPYRASLRLPGLSAGDRAVTVTLVLCLPDLPEPGQDNLFTLGRRSRWLTAHVDREGVVRIGLGNRWWTGPALGPEGTLRLVPGRWQAVTVGLGSDGTVCAAVDGRLSVRSVPQLADGAPRRIDGPDEDELSFADPGSARHLNGLVARVVVTQGLLDDAAITALHARLAVSALPRPTTPLFRSASGAPAGGDAPPGGDF